MLPSTRPHHRRAYSGHQTISALLRIDDSQSASSAASFCHIAPQLMPVSPIDLYFVDNVTSTTKPPREQEPPCASSNLEELTKHTRAEAAPLYLLNRSPRDSRAGFLYTYESLIRCIVMDLLRSDRIGCLPTADKKPHSPEKRVGNQALKFRGQTICTVSSSLIRQSIWGFYARPFENHRTW